MPVKRSRIGLSPSAVMSPPSPVRRKVMAAGDSAKVMKGSVEEERSGEAGSRILTVSSPMKAGTEVVGPGTGFLERCYGCKKEIGDADVFMYSYLRAFCSVECRERQIFIDNVAEVLSTACKSHTTYLDHPRGSEDLAWD